MSIDATKSIAMISKTLNRELINTQSQNQNKAISIKDSPVANTHVSLSAPTSTALLLPQHDINMAKVDQIKQAIKQGTLVINPQKIANELINQTLQDISTESVIKGKT